MQKAVLEGVFSLGLAQLSDYVLNEKNPVGVMRLEKLKRIFEEGKSLQLQFPAQDLGFWSDLVALLQIYFTLLFFFLLCWFVWCLIVVKLKVILGYTIIFHFNFVSYKEGALVADTSESTLKFDRSGSGTVSREYVPTGKPGSRLPHMHVKPLTEVSTKVSLFLMNFFLLNNLHGQLRLKKSQHKPDYWTSLVIVRLKGCKR